MERSISIRVVAAAVVAAVLVYSPTIGRAQRAGAIQLPTFRFFGMSTTVEVPDGGGASLGGNNSSASGRSERGIPGLGGRPFENVATGSANRGGSMGATATIHDMAAMDRRLLGTDDAAASSARPTANDLARQKLPVMLRHAATERAAAEKTDIASRLTVDAAGGASIAEIRREQSAEDAAVNAEAARLLDEGKQIAASGKPGVARVYYQMAWRRATGDLKKQIVAEISSLNRAAGEKDSVAARANW